MKTTKIKITNLFGIRETTLDGQSVELSGPKGAGKTSVLDAIRWALTNRSDREYVVRQGADKAEIIVETDSGLRIDRKAVPGKQAGTVKVTQGEMVQSRPAEFLSTIFTPLQLNPVEFTQMSRQEKNRVILSLIKFPWDTNWIREQFGEIPQGVDYSKHILEVLHDIQAENGVYFQSRQALNRDIRNKRAFVEDIAKTIPAGYDCAKWEKFPVAEKHRELAAAQENNSRIERAISFRANYEDKARGIKGQRDMDAAAIDKEIVRDRERLTGTVERLKAEIRAAEAEIDGLAQRKADRMAVVDANYKAAMAKLDADTGVANKYADRELVNTSLLQDELNTAEEMRAHILEYKRMVSMQDEIDSMKESADELTRKIELARELPGTILEQAELPIAGLTVEDGIPLINGLPISNLSDGELLELCVDVSVSNPGQLQIILVDGAERLDTDSRNRLYEKCKEKGLQLIATRVTDSDELQITEL